MTSPADEARIPLKRALISVYDKTGLDELVRGLHEAGVALVSTGGSAARIDSLGIPVTRVEELTGFPECLDGRVKTLHPRVHAGILADRRLDTHVQQLADLEIEPFDLVVSNLYPFTETVASGATPDECVEQIDIGGPSMVRAAAKNHPSVAIVTSPARYPDVLRAAAEGGFTLDERKTVGGRGVHPHGVVRRGGGVVDGQRADRHLRRDRLPGVDGRDLAASRRACGTARTRTSRRLSTGTGAEGWRLRCSCTARRCPTTTTSTPMRRGGRRTTSTCPRSRSSSMPTLAGSRSATTWRRRIGRRTSATRSRRSAASSPSTGQCRSSWPSRWRRSSPR